jgi:hypothetical protein|tara:strand:+ start:951 stop:1559 length:609 start_codon:yes stop_codon:yes gene_type:complete
MAKKYKLKEFEVGDVKVNDGVKSTVTDIDSTTGAISWSILQVPNIDRLLDESDDLVVTAKNVYQKVKDDKVFLDIYKQARSLRNVIRTHTRNNYPEEYKKSRGVNEEEIEEMSTTGGGAGSATFSAGTGMQYATPYAFKKKKKKVKEDSNNPGKDLGPGPKASEDGVKDNAYVKQFKYKIVPKTKDGTYVQKGSGLDVNKLF